MRLFNILYPTLFTISIILFFSNCQNQAEGEKAYDSAKSVKSDTPPPTSENATLDLPEKTEYGKFAYKHHRKTNGPKPYPGAYVQYHYSLKKNGEPLKSSFGTDPAPIGIMPKDEELQQKPTPLLEGLRLMSVGDSITISTIGTDFKDEFTYELVLLRIL